MCSCEDLEPCDVSAHERRKCRKDYNCAECGAIIERGSVCDYYAWLFDGAWTHARACKRCEVKRAAFKEAEGCFAPVLTLNEAIRECADEDPGFLRKYIAARRKLRAA